jgi:hypothetical protein
VGKRGGAFSTHGREEKCVRFLVAKPPEKKPVGRYT